MKTFIKQFWHGNLQKYNASSFKHQTHLQFEMFKLRVSGDLRCSVTCTTTNITESYTIITKSIMILACVKE
jgi:hypothetical protein